MLDLGALRRPLRLLRRFGTCFSVHILSFIKVGLVAESFLGGSGGMRPFGNAVLDG